MGLDETVPDMAKLTIKWRIDYEDSELRADVETGELATFVGVPDYVDSIRDSLRVILNPYKHE